MFTLKTITFAVCAAVVLEGCSSVPLTLAGAVLSGAVRSAADAERQNAVGMARQPAFAKDGAPLPEPETAEARYAVARAYQASGRLDMAIGAYRELITKHPTFADAYNGLGTTYSAQGRYTDAIATFEVGVTVAPQQARLYNNLGYAHLLRNAPDQAIVAFEKAIQLDPGYTRALNNLQTAQRTRIAPRVIEQHERALAASASGVLQKDMIPPPGLTSSNEGLQLVSVAPNILELQVIDPSSARVMASSRELKNQEPIMKSFKQYRVEVSNGNGITGFARRTAEKLRRDHGIPVARVTDYQKQQFTEIQYRRGYANEAAALAASLQADFSVVPAGELRRDIDVRIVLGTDLQLEGASFTPPVSARDRRIQLVSVRQQ